MIVSLILTNKGHLPRKTQKPVIWVPLLIFNVDYLVGCIWLLFKNLLPVPLEKEQGYDLSFQAG